MNRIVVKKPRLDKVLLCQMLVTFSLLALLQACSPFPMVRAQATPYERSGEISFEAIWYEIYGVKKNDQILISVTPAMSSAIFSPNMTKVDEANGVHGFLAKESGDYILRIVLGNDANYTVKSSHPLTDLNVNPTTPYSSTGVTQPEGGEIVWYKLYDVRQNDLVLISLYSPTGADLYTYVYYPDLTIMDQEYNYRQIIALRNFIAPVSGDYAFKFTTQYPNATYKINSSHPLTSGTQPTPTATITPTPSPSVSPSPTSTKLPLNVSVVASGSVTFEVPTSFPSGVDKFTYDFGDGTNMTTRDRKVTHVYENPGSYIFTLKLEGAPEVRVLETYIVTVTSPSENPLVKYTWPIVTGIIAGLSVATIIAFVKRRSKQV